MPLNYFLIFYFVEWARKLMKRRALKMAKVFRIGDITEIAVNLAVAVVVITTIIKSL